MTDLDLYDYDLHTSVGLVSVSFLPSEYLY